jgi:hypothetical protein
MVGAFPNQGAVSTMPCQWKVKFTQRLLWVHHAVLVRHLLIAITPKFESGLFDASAVAPVGGMMAHHLEAT